MTFPNPGWREASLGEICTFKYGKALPQASRSGGEFPVYGSNGIVGHHDSAITSGQTVVIGRKGSYGEINYSERACWPIDTAYFVDETATKQNIRWLSYRIANLGLNELNKAAAVPGLNREDAYRQRLLVPPISAQLRIAAILDQADALRAKRREALAQLDSLTQSIFIEMFGDPLSITRGSPHVPFESIANRITYGFTSPMKHLEAGIPILTAKNVLCGSLDLLNVHYADRTEFDALTSKSKPKMGDILITKDGTIGRCAVVNTDSELCINQSVALVQLQTEKVLPSYVLAYLNSNRLQQVMKNMSKGNALAHLQITELAKLPIPLPSLPKQMEFSERLGSLEKVMTVQTESAEKLDALFSSLQHRAFRGEL